MASPTNSQLSTYDRLSGTHKSHGVAGCIQVTERTYQRLQDGYRFQRRGPIPIRGMGEMVTYFLVGRNR